jgi:hypothetical protein
VIRLTLALLRLGLALRTDAGRDHQARVTGDNGSNGTGSYASASWIGVSANSVAPNAANTTLPGEIASGTLVRAQAIYAHTTGTNLYTLTKTFTSDQTVTINKYGIFNAASSGTLCYETIVDAVNLRTGDQFQITAAFTL